ncbi:COX assembly mitochondrial protein 2 homolog [Malaya genurostris]|uniref:COX assembly mitochondrial protein 2 homolog n=1 Tax=Malaya genurostris TaxID=325434 RepID=UPI0026F3C30C|nr:COX assembly mitochondrial protein 2 homolog [Malaya genurostris]
MHSDLSPHLHTPECNKLINLLKQCHAERKFARFVGVCNTFDQNVVDCLRNERIERSRENRDKARKEQQRVRERMRQLEKDQEARH